MFSKKSFLPMLLLFTAFGLAISLYFSSVRADQDLISLFPIEHYDQNLNNWIKSNDKTYDKTLLSSAMQEHHLSVLYDHYFGLYSPWEPSYISQILHKTPPDDLLTIEKDIIQQFNNLNKPESEVGYGENFRPYSQKWFAAIKNNIPLNQLQDLHYHPENRAIAINNLNARVLPTTEVFFYHYKKAGQGYPFDNFQMSSVWAGTPLYILCETQDHRWSLVVTPDFIGWIQTQGLARTNQFFINTWKAAAKKQLVAIIHSETPLLDEDGQFRLTGYIGSFFPAEASSSEFKLFLPITDAHRHARIIHSTISDENATIMPLSPTPRHFSQVMSTLIGRPYGWGGMYFYNDCSAELKNLLTPFGIWLPRHSSNQVYAGKMIDKSSASIEQRLVYLINNGHPFLTLVYIGGHVFLYIGNYDNPNDKDHPTMVLSYQNLWGLSPNPPIRRAVVGMAVLIPILIQYPEDNSLISLAGKKYFQVAYLDELPNYQIRFESINLKALMSVD